MWSCSLPLNITSHTFLVHLCIQPPSLLSSALKHKLANYRVCHLSIAPSVAGSDNYMAMLYWDPCNLFRFPCRAGLVHFKLVMVKHWVWGIFTSDDLVKFQRRYMFLPFPKFNAGMCNDVLWAKELFRYHHFMFCFVFFNFIFGFMRLIPGYTPHSLTSIELRLLC